MTALYGVIGDPIAHSLSPVIHNGWFRDHDLDAAYVPMQVAAGEFSDAMKTLARRGAKGVNVTQPHKHDALAVAKSSSDAAKVIGASNTLTHLEDGGWHADNTDAPGFISDLRAQGVEAVDGLSIFIIGAGGAARGVVYALKNEGAAITVCNRTLEKAEKLAKNFGGCEFLSLEEGLTQASRADMIINTASFGYSGKSLKLPESDGKLFYDISFGKAAAPMLKAAAEKGWRTADGLGMLVAQAAASFKIWTGIEPSHEAGLERCRTAAGADS